MKNIAAIAVICVWGACLVSCSPSEAPSTLTLTANAITLSSKGDPSTIEIKSTIPWNISGSLPDWLTVTPTSGQGDASIQVRGVPNTKTQRTAEIRFVPTQNTNNLSATLRVSQPVVSLNLSLSSVQLEYGVTTFGVTISTEAAWSIEGVPDWYTISPMSGSGSSSLTVSVTANNTPNDRTGTASIKFYDSATSFSVTQLGAIYADGEVLQYMHSSKSQPVILVFTGDGYIKEDCKMGGLFEQNAAEGIEALFSIEPYKSYREYFSVYIVFAHSLERGASQVNLGITKQTCFNATFTSTTSSGTNITADNTKAYEYAQKVPGMAEYGINNTAVFMMVNQDRYGGTCTMNTAGRSVAKIPVSRRNGNSSYANVLLHEGGGHGFGRFVDEYVSNETQIPDNTMTTDRSYQNRGMYLNVDFTDDPQSVYWAHLINQPFYDRVGIYQGGALYRYGVWRAEETNCMINNIQYYNAICRELIVRRILTISGEGFTVEKFLAKDLVRTPGAPAIMEARAFDPQTFIPLAPPEVEID